MQNNLDQRIKEERALVTVLDSTLDTKRTQYLRGQLQRAADILDDASYALRFSEIAEPNHMAMWTGFAEINIQIAEQLRQKVTAVVEMYGGPQHLIEIGG